MKSLLVLILVPSLLLLAACGGNSPETAAKKKEKGPKKPAQLLGETLAPLDSTLTDSLRAIERRSGGRLGVAAIHLESGWRASYRGRETFPMASVAKLPMAIRFLRLVDSGAFRIDSSVRLTYADYHPGGSTIYRQTMRDSGGLTSIHALLDAMLVHSDNTAADYILKLSGGPRTVDRLMASYGLERTDITNSERDLILLWGGVDPREGDSAWTRERVYRKIQEAGDTVWHQAQDRLADSPEDAAPPNEMALLLALIAKRSFLSDRMTDTLLTVMSRAVTGKARIPALLPAGTPVAHKTGTIGTTANDVGIITLPEGRGHLVVAIFVKGSKANTRARERAIAEASALLYRRAMARGR